MDFLKSEIQKKRKQLEEKNIVCPGKKYFKRGDLIAQQTEAYWEKHHGKTEQEEQTQVARDTNEEAMVPVVSATDFVKDPQKPMLSRKEVIRRLRERGEPILLFGETECDTFQRLRKLEILEPEKVGMRNDFKTAMDKMDQEYFNEVAKAEIGSTSSEPSATHVSIKDDGTTLQEILEFAKDLGTGDNDLDCDTVLKFGKFMLKVWGEAINNQPEEVKRSMKVKLERTLYHQTVSYLKPLFRKLKTRSIPTDLMESLVLIIKFLLAREYVQASDAYLQMAIGNAPWPIGVTMPGIHARTGREKISSKYVGHVLNDETQRKYIQGLKRLMTQCQKFYPADPSKSMEYNAFNFDT
ncbi:PREDICTED: pre-mRNA-splicing factor 18-like isoform X2 [Priapulus caudatus]|nr:PREDICTED: pre-mRNA-splicing factor 18-like isoform X2 [Priapulus caudatus]